MWLDTPTYIIGIFRTPSGVGGEGFLSCRGDNWTDFLDCKSEPTVKKGWGAANGDEGMPTEGRGRLMRRVGDIDEGRCNLE